MANGFKSCHPYTVAILEELGVQDEQVTQGWGSAEASAHTHDPVGSFGGVTYGPCVDLAYGLANPDFIMRLWEAGFIAFVRDKASGWSHSKHIHAVCLGLVDDAGDKHLPPICNTQVTDFLHSPPLSGLKDHGYLQGNYKPTPAVQARLRKQYQAWWPGHATKVLSPEGHAIACYAALEGDAVTAEVPQFAQYWDKPMPELPSQTFDGRFYRAAVREMAEAVGLKIAGFAFNKPKTACTVQLAY